LENTGQFSSCQSCGFLLAKHGDRISFLSFPASERYHYFGDIWLCFDISGLDWQYRECLFSDMEFNLDSFVDFVKTFKELEIFG
jgi:hypothetical protein